MTPNAWSPEEDELLRELVGSAPMSTLVGRLKRSESAIRHRCLSIGLPSPVTAYQESRSRRDTIPAPPPDGSVPSGRPERPEIHPIDRQVAREEESAKDRQIRQLVSELRDAHARNSFLHEIAESVRRTPVRILPRETHSGQRVMTPVVLASDWHVEEPVDPAAVAYRNKYDLEIAARRVVQFFQAAVWLVEHHRADGFLSIRDLVLWLGGDLMTGYIHAELVESNALSPTETVQWLLPRLRDGIKTLLDRLQLARLVIPCSFGNHGRTTDKPRVATGYANSYEWLMYNILASEFRDDRRVEFVITPSAHQYVQIYDWLLHFHHGDDVKYMGGVGGLGIPLLKAVPQWDLVQRADWHCIGHHHQLLDFGRALVNGSLIGYGPYSQRIRATFEPPQQLMFFVDRKRGKCMPTALWVDESEPAFTSVPESYAPPARL